MAYTYGEILPGTINRTNNNKVKRTINSKMAYTYGEILPGTINSKVAYTYGEILLGTVNSKMAYTYGEILPGNFFSGTGSPDESQQSIGVFFQLYVSDMKFN